MFQRAIAVAAVWLLASASSGAEGDAATEDVYARYKDRVLQVRIVDRASGAKAGIGSGFSASPDGHVVTNYHVVAELVHRPEQYRAQYLLEGGSSGALELMDVDVVHDLAVLRAEGLGPSFFALATAPPVKGERLFSLGNPFDLGFTIVEGTYNGLMEKSLHDKIHFTGSINPGMSGGPTLNRAGQVVGVNVSTAGNQVSFLVPAGYAAPVLARAHARADAPEDLLGLIRDQVFENQERYMAGLLGAELTSAQMSDYSVPGELADFFNCWGDTPRKDDAPYDLVYHACSTSDDIYLSRDLSSGAVKFRHELFTTEELGPVRFYSFLEEHLNRPHLSFDGEEHSVTDYECRSSFVEHDGLSSKVIFCLRGYKKLEGIYDSFLTANSLTRNDETLHTTLALSGVSFENAVRFSRRYLEAIAWKP